MPIGSPPASGGSHCPLRSTSRRKEARPGRALIFDFMTSPMSNTRNTCVPLTAGWNRSPVHRSGLAVGALHHGVEQHVRPRDAVLERAALTLVVRDASIAGREDHCRRCDTRNSVAV